MCDPRVRRALLFRCMVAELCWHFSNFSWLCKVFLQTFLYFASQFCNLKVISKLGGDFAAISKLGDHFIAIWKFENHLATNSHFRSKWRIWQGVAMGLRKHFAAGCHFRSPFRSCKMGLGGCEMALVCQRGVSQMRNTLRNGTLAAKFPLVLCAFIFKRP